MYFIEPFIKYTVHIGHSAVNSLVLSSWFFYKLKKKIWIINILKTIIFLKIIFKFFKYIVTYNFPFRFVNLELTKEFLFKNFANICGEFSCTRVWVRGFLSNFKSIQHSISKYILKKHIIKSYKKTYLINYWSITRFTWPRGIFLSDIIFNYVVSKEAASITLPVAAMIDTNIKSFLFTFPIPSNDDAMESVCYILSILSTKLLLLKYKKLILWYTHYSLKKKQLNNIFLKLENLNLSKLLKLMQLKLQRLVSLNHFVKMKKNMTLMTTMQFKNEKKSYFSSNSSNISQFNILLLQKQHYFHKLSIFYCFCKKALQFFRFKITKRYKKLIVNFIKLDKSKLVLDNQKRNKWKKLVAKKFFILNTYLISALFKTVHNFYESYMNKRIADLAIVLKATRWRLKTRKYNKNLAKTKAKFKNWKNYEKKYWLFPYIRKFSIKRSKNRWFHSVSFFKELNKFDIFYHWKRQKISSISLNYYNNWFFFLLKKLKK